MGSAQANQRALALIRIVIGIFFFAYGEYKVFGTEFIFHGGFQEGLRGFLSSGSAFPFARPFLNAVLAHAAMPVALLVAYGELAIGLSLLAGVLSRIASIFGFILCVLLWLAGGYPGPRSPFWEYLASSGNWSILALCFAVLVMGRSEEVWSLASIRRALGQN